MDNLPAEQMHKPAMETSVLDPDDARSVVNLVPKTVRLAIETCAAHTSSLFTMDETELYKFLSSNEKRPSATDNRLRLKFWDEYDRVQAHNQAQMNISNVISGICSRELFYSNYLKRAEKVAWLLCPPAGYMTKANEALEFGLEQLRDILDQPHVVNGRLDTKIGELKAKIVAMLDTRVKGAVVQKSMNLNLSASSNHVTKAVMGVTAEDLMKQMKELDRKNRQASNLPLASPEPEKEEDDDQ